MTHFIDGETEPQESTKAKVDPNSLALHPKEVYSALWSVIARKAGRKQREGVGEEGFLNRGVSEMSAEF